MESIKAKLKENIAHAIQALEDYPEEKFMENWSMVNGDRSVVLQKFPAKLQFERGLIEEGEREHGFSGISANRRADYP